MYIINFHGVTQALAIDAHSFDLNKECNALIFKDKEGKNIGFQDIKNVRSVFRHGVPEVYSNKG